MTVCVLIMGHSEWRIWNGFVTYLLKAHVLNVFCSFYASVPWGCLGLLWEKETSIATEGWPKRLGRRDVRVPGSVLLTVLCSKDTQREGSQCLCCDGDTALGRGDVLGQEGCPWAQPALGTFPRSTGGWQLCRGSFPALGRCWSPEPCPGPCPVAAPLQARLCFRAAVSYPGIKGAFPAILLLHQMFSIFCQCGDFSSPGILELPSSPWFHSPPTASRALGILVPSSRALTITPSLLSPTGAVSLSPAPGRDPWGSPSPLMFPGDTSDHPWPGDLHWAPFWPYDFIQAVLLGFPPCVWGHLLTVTHSVSHALGEDHLPPRTFSPPTPSPSQPSPP